jgi:hypothetical protein
LTIGHGLDHQVFLDVLNGFFTTRKKHK